MRTSVDVDGLGVAAARLQEVAEALSAVRLDVAAAADELGAASGGARPVLLAADLLSAAAGRHLSGAASRTADLSSRVRAGGVTYRAVDARAVPPGGDP